MDTECPICTEPAAIDWTMPGVSFRTDVLPIFRATCNAVICHGQPLPGNSLFPGAGLYLGPATDPMVDPDEATISAIVDALMAASKTAPAMPIVTPGDEANSFLIAKIYGCQNDRGLACTQQSKMLIECSRSPCGDVMPPRSLPVQLSADQRNTIHRWVAQGALDN